MKNEIGISLIPDEIVMNKIYLIRGQKVMIDKDLSELYQIKTKALKQAARRNLDIFPEHFMFEMNEDELQNWRSQFVTSNSDKMGLRYKPFCFTEFGVLQLANVIKSPRAKQMSIRIIEIFVKLKKIIIENSAIRIAIEKLEMQTNNNTKNIEIVFKYFEELLDKKKNPRVEIGFKIPRK